MRREAAILASRRVGALDADRPITENSHIEPLLTQIAELQASRKRLLLAANDDRRRIERDVHGGIQQQLVALAVNVQLARELIDADPAAASALLGDIAGDVQLALNESTQLAGRIYPPLDAVSLATTLRSAAINAGASASVDIVTRKTYPSEIAAALYWYWLEVLDELEDDSGATLRMWDDGVVLSFELVANSDGVDAASERLRDRVEALGGRVMIHLDPGPRTRLDGSISLAE